jgi:hypothetical protein
MSRSDTEMRPRRRRFPSVWRDLLASELVAVVCAAAVALVVATLAVHSPSFVPQVTVLNESELDIVVDVAPADGGSSLFLTIAGTGQAKTTIDVLDQGHDWVFRFRSQGLDGGELRISRSDLESASWRVTVPAAVIAHLREQGAAPNPSAGAG